MSRPAPYPATDRLLDTLAQQQWEQPPPDTDRLQALVRDCLEKMSRRYQNLLQDYYYECLTYRQIAVRYGWPNKGSAHWHVQRAVAELGRRVRRTLAKENREDQ